MAGSRRQVRMFDDAPTVASVAQVFDDRLEPLVRRVVEELAFVMKTCTRLGRTVVVETDDGLCLLWGHRDAPTMEALRRGAGPFDVADLEGPTVGEDDLIDVVTTRQLLPTAVAGAVVAELFTQVAALHRQGLAVGTPTRWLGEEEALEAELIGNLEVLGWLGLDLRLHRSEPDLGLAERPDVVCRDAEGGWVVLELVHRSAQADMAALLTGYVDAVADQLAAPGEPVVGYLLSDGAAPGFALDDDRLGQLNLRALDLPSTRAQRWDVGLPDGSAGWVAVAADGETLVNGGGDALPGITSALDLTGLALQLPEATFLPRPIGS